MTLSDAFDDLDETLALPDSLAQGPLDEHRVNGILRSIARKRRALADARAVAEAEIDRIRLWLDDQKQRHDTAALEQVLADYHRARLDADPKAKTIRLPDGELHARSKPAEWTFDDDAFLDWAAIHLPGAVRVKASVDRTAAKKALTPIDGRAVDPDTGECAPGVTVTEGGTSYSIKLADGGDAW